MAHAALAFHRDGEVIMLRVHPYSCDGIAPKVVDGDMLKGPNCYLEVIAN